MISFCSLLSTIDSLGELAHMLYVLMEHCNGHSEFSSTGRANTLVSNFPDIVTLPGVRESCFLLDIHGVANPSA